MLSACVAAGIGVSLLGTDWCINPIVLWVEWWFDGKHFSSLNRMKSNCASYSSCLQRVRRELDWFHTTTVLDVVWHSWAGDHDKLFCVQSVSECQFHTRSHDSVDAFLDCLPDWAQGLRHSQCSRWHTENAVCHCLVASARSSGFLEQSDDTSTFWALVMRLSDRYFNTWTERTYVQIKYCLRLFIHKKYVAYSKICHFLVFYDFPR